MYLLCVKIQHYIPYTYFGVRPSSGSSVPRFKSYWNVKCYKQLMLVLYSILAANVQTCYSLAARMLLHIYIYIYIYMCVSFVICYTGLLKMIVWVLTTCHTQHTWDSSICVFLFNRTTPQVFVTYLTGALYVHPLWFYKHQHDNRVRSKLSVACQQWWFQWRFWLIPSVPGYLREEEEHKPDPWRNPIERNLKNEVQVVKTPTIISNNPVFQ